MVKYCIVNGICTYCFKLMNITKSRNTALRSSRYISDSRRVWSVRVYASKKRMYFEPSITKQRMTLDRMQFMTRKDYVRFQTLFRELDQNLGASRKDNSLYTRQGYPVFYLDQQFFSFTPDKDMRVIYLDRQFLSHPCYLNQDRI